MVESSVRKIANDRASLYHWFAMAFFAPPTMEQVQDMQTGKAASLLNALQACSGAEIGIQSMRSLLASGGTAIVTAGLGVAYARLFYGAGGHDTASLYHSVYSSEYGLLCQEATAEMERVLRQHRLCLDGAIKEPSDHLSVQLEVMSQLALRFSETSEQESDRLPGLRTEQAAFLSDQLLSWLPDFSLRVIDLDAQGFYAGLASVLLCMAQQDLAYLTDPQGEGA